MTKKQRNNVKVSLETKKRNEKAFAFVLIVVVFLGIITLIPNPSVPHPYDVPMEKDEARIFMHEKSEIEENENSNFFQFEEPFNYTAKQMYILLEDFDAEDISYEFNDGVLMTEEYQVDSARQFFTNFTVEYLSFLDTVSVWGSTPGVSLNFLIYNASWSHLYSMLLPDEPMDVMTKNFTSGSGLLSANFSRYLDPEWTDNSTFFLGLSVNLGSFRWAYDNSSDTQIAYELGVRTFEIDLSYQLTLKAPGDLQTERYSYSKSNPETLNHTIPWGSLSYTIEECYIAYEKELFQDEFNISLVVLDDPNDLYEEKFYMVFRADFTETMSDYRIEIVVSNYWDFTTPMERTPARCWDNYYGSFRNITGITIDTYRYVHIMNLYNVTGLFLVESYQYYPPNFTF